MGKVRMYLIDKKQHLACRDRAKRNRGMVPDFSQIKAVLEFSSRVPQWGGRNFTGRILYENRL